MPPKYRLIPKTRQEGKNSDTHLLDTMPDNLMTSHHWTTLETCISAPLPNLKQDRITRIAAATLSNITGAGNLE
jgi:hypothetical protein